MADTFSWVEPTSLAVIALKKAGLGNRHDAAARIEEAERLLLDRACAFGGWNYGNPRVMQQDLRPQVPPTGCALLALRARATEPAVTRGLAYLERDSDGLRSPLALGWIAIVLRAYGRPVDAALTRLESAVPDALRHGNLHAMAVALTALTTAEVVFQ
jgi:hypothetical protein